MPVFPEEAPLTLESPGLSMYDPCYHPSQGWTSLCERVFAHLSARSLVILAKREQIGYSLLFRRLSGGGEGIWTVLQGESCLLPQASSQKGVGVRSGGAGAKKSTCLFYLATGRYRPVKAMLLPPSSKAFLL